MKTYYIYIMTNKNNSVLYIGVTNNLVKRVCEHKNFTIKCFTSRYNLNKLIYGIMVKTR
jgi:putative endonuclease